jgi:mono/diheme cytochrome c family protein
MLVLRFSFLATVFTLGGVAIAQESPQVTQGAGFFQQHCSKCHGADGQGGEGYATPLWGKSAQIKRFKTADELHEYNLGIMPFDNPAAIGEKEKLAIVAYILAKHGVIKPTETVDEKRLPKLNIP